MWRGGKSGGLNCAHPKQKSSRATYITMHLRCGGIYFVAKICLSSLIARTQKVVKTPNFYKAGQYSHHGSIRESINQSAADASSCTVCGDEISDWLAHSSRHRHLRRIDGTDESWVDAWRLWEINELFSHSSICRSKTQNSDWINWYGRIEQSNFEQKSNNRNSNITFACNITTVVYDFSHSTVLGHQQCG